MPSTPSVSLDVLRTLHRIHRQLTDLRDRLDRGPKQIRAGTANVKHREGELAHLREELKALRKAADEKQLQLRATEGKIKDLRIKLNTATSNREYQVLREQIDADEMANSVLEDEIIELLEKVDRFQPKIAEAEKVLAAARATVAKVEAEVKQRAPTIHGDIARLEAELQQYESKLPPLIREVYQRVVRQKGEDALAEVEDGCCAGCHQSVPLNIQAEIRLAHASFCRTCGRLLYFAQDSSPTPGRED